ncbi:ornithine cyclodeaminase family protein [Halorhabdus salina]|uniref:ornithine cyclodeaminase family protein n=1 Tax=Halorhabdus salina TaxID=2750670 RepID=UPI0015EF093E|nr:ornithine cyclodeaminase family protein [Halorhabdus salina]
METALLGPETIGDVIEIEDVVAAVESAFTAEASGTTEMPAKSYIDLPQYGGDFRSMPAYLDTGEWDGAAVKWVNVHPDNPADHDLPTVMGTIVYADPETGFPLAVLDGTTITRLRTGAAAAVATKHLAREDATSLGIVGAGRQADTQLAAIATVRDIQRVVVSDIDDSAVAAFIERFGDRFDVSEGSVEAAAACDVVSTITPVREPIVTAVGEQTHVNAMGADAAGKHEIADEILQASRIVIDDYEQCVHSGEINVPYSEGILTDDDIAAELGAVVAGEATGRTPETERTVFDSTGLAIQDVATSHVAYESAQAAGLGEDYRLVDTTS